MENRKVVLVTGPAGNLGSAVVQRFPSEKVSFLLIDHHPDRLSALYPDLSSSPHHLLISGIDLLDKESANNVVIKGLDTFGRIDCLVHTVGGFSMGETVAELSDITWEHMMDLNVKSLLNVIRPVIPHMIEQGEGKIITVGSKASFQGKPRMAAYSAAKATVLRLTESLSAELKTSGINVNCLIPGTIDTPENRQAMPNADTSRWVSPASLADIIHFLCSSASDDIHGAAITVYGA